MILIAARFLIWLRVCPLMFYCKRITGPIKSVLLLFIPPNPINICNVSLISKQN